MIVVGFFVSSLLLGIVIGSVTMYFLYVREQKDYYHLHKNTIDHNRLFLIHLKIINYKLVERFKFKKTSNQKFEFKAFYQFINF